MFAPLLCFSARKYLQDDCLRCAQPLRVAGRRMGLSVFAFPVISQAVWRGLVFIRMINYFCTHLAVVCWNELYCRRTLEVMRSNVLERFFGSRLHVRLASGHASITL